MGSPTIPIRRSVLRTLLTMTVAVASLGTPTLAQDASPAVGSHPPADPSAPVEGTITLYTSATQDTVDAVLGALAEVHPGLAVEVFRAPTGELDARIASEVRSGGIGADVLWVSDPLSLQRYDADGLLAPLPPDAVEVVPTEYRTETMLGTRLLNLVIVAGQDLEPAIQDWQDLADPAYAGAVAIPDPGFAGSGFAFLGHLAATPELGIGFLQRLRDNGAIQVGSPADIVTGVAEGRQQAGVSIDKLVSDAATQGAPIELVWPASGAVVVYSPVAILAGSDAAQAAEGFVEFLVSDRGQAAIASTGWQPVRPDVPWSGGDGPVVTPDWTTLFGTQDDLLEAYRAVFGD